MKDSYSCPNCGYILPKKRATVSKKVIERKIIVTWRNALKSTKNFKKIMSHPVSFYGTPHGSFFLDSEGINSLNEILEELKKNEDIARKFSNKYLEALIKDVIIELLPVQPKNILKEVKIKSNKLFNVLSQSEVNWLIVIPIINLEIRTRFFNVGTVRFSRFAKATKKRILGNARGKFKKLLQDEFLPKYENTTVASVCVSAVDDIRANELGISAINDAINILRFYRLNPHFRNIPINRNNINTAGRLHIGEEIILCLRNPPKFDKILPSLEKTGFLFPLEITHSGLKAFRNNGFNLLTNMLIKKEKDRTDFEKRVLSAVHFCALSTYDESITNAFINNIVSLEAILIRGKEPKSGNVAERVALIVGRNLNDKKWLFEQMIRLYRIRSEIVHEGNTDLAPSDLRLLQLVNYALIINLLKLSKKQNFVSVSQLISWCVCQKFS